jgi:hypothetical protein
VALWSCYLRVMRAPYLFLTFLALPLGCGSSDSTTTPIPPADSATDTQKSDTSTTDAPADVPVDAIIDEGTDTPADSTTDSAIDSAKDVATDVAKDGSSAKCTLDTDCRKFSSYCNGTVLKPCTCYAFGATDPDPKCDGGSVTCVIDPCAKKTAWCNAGVCDLK